MTDAMTTRAATTPALARARRLLDALPAIAAVLALLAAGRAVAQSVTLRAGSDSAFVGEPLRVVVEISDLDAFEGPFVPEVDGLEIRRTGGEQTSTRMEIVNGRMRQEKTVAITFEITPRRTGTFEVPEFRVRAGTTTYATEPFALKASVSETGDLLRATVRASPDPLYVGQKGTLDLEIAIKRYRDERLGITLDEASLWSLVDRERSEWGAFFPALQKMASENRRPRGEIRVVDGAECVVYTISRAFDPIAAGPPAIGEVRVRMEYPTGLRRGDDLFFENRLTLAGSRPISTVPVVDGVEVLSPPEAGRPELWNGAVGDFEVRATARPGEVAVGDPITITLRVTDTSGTSGLEGLLAPDLASQPGFAEGFRVPRDAAAGAVEGRSKVFTQSVRALDEGVTAIPPIEFAFYNPATERYEFARTDAIPIRVTPSAIARVERAPTDVADAPSPQAPAAAVAGGLLANASPEECAWSGEAGGTLLAVTATPPIALAALMALGARLRRGRDPRLERRARARAEFEATVAARPASAEVLEQALLRYVGARLGATGDGLSRRDALGLLERGGVDAALRDEFDRELRACERARYAGDRTECDAGAARGLVARLENATVASSLAPEADRP